MKLCTVQNIDHQCENRFFFSKWKHFSIEHDLFSFHQRQFFFQTLSMLVFEDINIFILNYFRILLLDVFTSNILQTLNYPLRIVKDSIQVRSL